MPSFTQDAQQPFTAVENDDIGHKACQVFVGFVNQGGQCAAASQGFGVANEISNNLKWTNCDIANILQRCRL